jgi:isopentenyl diphosphate isomerase/L-lactate dehydrogenase-like FMN-dependent dehydrogenase
MKSKLSDGDRRKLLGEMRAVAGIDAPDRLLFRAGCLAALDCYGRGGLRHDGITLSETGGKMTRWRPGAPKALEGWEWMWDRIDRLFSAAP